VRINTTVEYLGLRAALEDPSTRDLVLDAMAVALMPGDELTLCGACRRPWPEAGAPVGVVVVREGDRPAETCFLCHDCASTPDAEMGPMMRRLLEELLGFEGRVLDFRTVTAEAGHG